MNLSKKDIAASTMYSEVIDAAIPGLEDRISQIIKFTKDLLEEILRDLVYKFELSQTTKIKLYISIGGYDE